jgi:hypothetical protein
LFYFFEWEYDLISFLVFIFAKTIITMIQRIQSIYLLLASLASAGVFALPFATATLAEPNSTLFNDGRYTAQDSMMLMLIFGLNAFLAVAAIFLFKNRNLQSRVAMLGTALALASAALAFMTFTQDSWAVANLALVKDQYGLGLPIFAAIFYLMARFNIKKDDKLVSSMDRLR